jgi:23S rRNA (pseudouridine1915-N3)-methyltransferase
VKITLAVVGKTTNKFIADGISDYSARLVHYVPFSISVIADLRSTKSLSEAQQKQREGVLLLNSFEKSDFVVLLDERGDEFSSVDFSAFIQKRMASGARRLVFVIGGPYGFSADVYSRADAMISLSRMTFPHELVRLVFVEQLYRAFTILNHEPYHHQ